MLSSLFMVAFAAQVADDGFSKLQIFLQQLIDWGVSAGGRIIGAVIIFVVGRFLISFLRKMLARLLAKRHVDASIQSFVKSLVNILLTILLIIAVIGKLGVETTSFAALLASAGVAIGMAMSGTLQNFAGGVLILLLKPYKIGDYIEAQGYGGTVKEIQIFHTRIVTPDNKSIILPNGGLSTSSINNWSKEDYRRVSWDIAISYGDDVEKMRAAVLEMFAADDRIVEKYVEDDRVKHNEPEDGIPDDVDDEPEADDKPRGFFGRLFHHNRKVKNAIDEWRERKKEQLKTMLPRADRSPAIILEELADSAVKVTIRAWVRSENYWTVYYDYNERFYNELPKRAGINFPFPQVDVHITK